MKEIDNILSHWDEVEEVRLNSDAKVLKQEYLRKMQGKSAKGRSSAVRSTGDLTEQDIIKIQQRIRKQQEEKKHQVFVPLHQDYQQKMREELYNQKSSKPRAEVPVKRNKVQFETKKSISFEEEETKQSVTNFWDDFSQPKTRQQPVDQRKKAQSTKDTQEKDPFSWDFDQPTKSKYLQYKLTLRANSAKAG